jgi:type I restriction enzyme S subunit
MQRYDKYKDSGVDWIGEIPSHWEVEKVKNVFKLVTEPAHTNNNYELLSVYTEIGVRPRKDLEEKGNKASTTDGYWKVKKGDFIVNKLLAWMGAVGVSEYDGVTSPAYDILRNKRPIQHSFYHELFRNKSFIQEMKKHSKGIMDMRLRLYFDKFGDIRIPFPPLSEQQTIATFLDDKTSKIDQTIALKQKEITLLKERRQILIQKAVTKGLDNQVKMKDSGVDWIGEIPEHWEVRKLKHCLFSKLKYGANESGIGYNSELPRYVRITDFGYNGKLSEEKKLSLTWSQGKDYLLKDGDILFARSGATVGKSYQFKTSMSIEKNYAFAGYLIKAEVDEKIISSDYLYLYTNSNLFENWKSAIFIKATIENIGADKYSSLLVVIPPITEQREIIEDYFMKNEKNRQSHFYQRTRNRKN